MRTFIARYEAWFLLALLPIICLASAWGVASAIPLPSDDDFDVVGWELRHLPNKWLYLAERSLGGGLSPEDEDQRLGRFLLLTARISRLERTSSAQDAAKIDELRRERDSLENDVEAIFEGRLTAVLEDAGLDSGVPLFPGARWVFPPVDVEFDRPLQVLSVSPRERIELTERRPLRLDTTADDAVRLEVDVESDGSRSALVEPVAGAATYPSIVAPRGNYERLAETVAHEWVHHYLTFKPLGLRYLSSIELRTLNETVANLAGRELAVLLVERHPLPPEIAAEIEGERPPAPAVDVESVLRKLRLEVETLLLEGRVEAAETLMEERRRELAEQGVVYRRINQAFFASRSVYADTAASIDPLGPKLEELLERSGAVGPFLRQAAQLTSAADLGRLLAGDR